MHGYFPFFSSTLLVVFAGRAIRDPPNGQPPGAARGQTSRFRLPPPLRPRLPAQLKTPLLSLGPPPHYGLRLAAAVAAAMGRPSGSGVRKTPPFISPSSSLSSSSYSKGSRPFRRLPSLPKPPLAPPAPHFAGRRRKKAPARLWMRMDRWGGCEVFMCDKAFVAERSGVHMRELRVIGPLLSRCPSILAREKAMVINLEFIRAIVTADEVLLLEPLAQEVIPFIDKLRHHFPLKSIEVDVGATQVDNLDGEHAQTGAECELPFEFQVLELTLEAVCLSFNSSLSDLNRHAVFVLDELTKNVSTRNLERVRSLKSNLTSLLAGVQKVRDEVEHLLDHNENMAQLHLSRKQTKNQQDQALLASAAINSIFSSKTSLARPNSIINQAMGVATSATLDTDAGNLEMLLESYFIQLDGIRNRIAMVRGYIVDTEDYINIQLDNQRNQLIQFHLILIIVSFGIAINTWIVASFAMNLPHNGDKNTAVGPFLPFVGATSSFCLLVVVVLFAYAWRNRLLSS
ncbi:putative magnesium transporter MRS2-H [Dichanthelium oligosanthes]|uniref:Magnesium transporter n=1 Tax=Dichanthelium oligosanthes TaxID=888268 RepID=A0A1E5VQ13_9POAL|nr:putative magnesium transporter MRS2-H [Dichanthelium oligosanthes]